MKTRFTVKGMHCGSCVMNIEDALLDTPGVTDASASLRGESVVVDHDESVDKSAIQSVIVDAGYEAIE